MVTPLGCFCKSRESVRHLIESVRYSCLTANWYGALHGALTLPDIAAKIDGRPQKTNGARYASWFDDYVKPKYTASFAITKGGQKHVFLNGNDCYALRCAYLHEGDFDITAHSARDILERFVFVASWSD